MTHQYNTVPHTPAHQQERVCMMYDDNREEGQHVVIRGEWLTSAISPGDIVNIIGLYDIGDRSCNFLY